MYVYRYLKYFQYGEYLTKHKEVDLYSIKPVQNPMCNLHQHDMCNKVQYRCKIFKEVQ
jgi:hypothetical protein